MYANKIQDNQTGCLGGYKKKKRGVRMTKEELININGIREDLYQAMQIGDITLSSKNSQKLVDFMNYQDKEIERLNKQLQLISDEFLKYDWENSSKEQIIFQLKNLYNFIFKGSDNK